MDINGSLSTDVTTKITASEPNQQSLEAPLFCKVYIACQSLRLSTETRFSAIVLLHRYLSHYRFHQVQDKNGVPTSNTSEEANEVWHHLGNVAAACMFLACKSNNQSRRIRDVMNACHILQFQHPEPKDADSDAITVVVKKYPKPINEQYWSAKETIVKVEQHVLRMLQFDVTVSQPHRMLVVIYEEVGILLGEQHTCTRERHESALKFAWKRLNDAMFYLPALRLDCLSLACAALCLGLDECRRQEGVKDNSAPSDCNQKLLHSNWWEAVGANEANIQDAKEKLKEAAVHLSNVKL
jgi:hypothetical protein